MTTETKLSRADLQETVVKFVELGLALCAEAKMPFKLGAIPLGCITAEFCGRMRLDYRDVVDAVEKAIGAEHD